MLKKSWEHQSVLIGIYLVKAAMLVSGRNGPLLYTCLLTQIYCFANVINHRCDSKPGATFLIHMLFVYFTMHQYFFRGSHRERINSVQFGKVCPGGIFCGEILHWILIIFELTASYIICLFLLPLIVKARVKDAYGMTRVASVEVKGKKGKVSTEKVVTTTQFNGTMALGMVCFQMIALLLVIFSSLFVWWTRYEVIFPQRSAPKFIFDVGVALIFVPFQVFWQ